MESFEDRTAVIIPYHRGHKFINICVASILDHSLVKIFIVDNDPSQNTLKFENDQVLPVKTNSFIGFARAVNIGVRHAIELGFESFIVLNQDTILREGSLLALTEYLSPDRDHVFIPLIHEYGRTEMSSHFIKRTWEKKKVFSNLVTTGHFEVNKASAACVAFHKHTFVKVGYFDPLFFMYGEDDDWFQRLRLLGGKVILTSAAAIDHVHSLQNANKARRKQISKWQFYASTILGLRYENKNVWFILKRMLLALFRLGSLPLYYQIYSLLFRLGQIKKYDASSVNKRAFRKMDKDLLGSS